MQTVTEWLSENPDAIDRVIFNVFKDEDKRYYEEFFDRPDGYIESIRKGLLCHNNERGSSVPESGL